MAADPMASDDAGQLELAESLISLSLASGHEPRPPRTAVLFQPACTLHRYIRTTDDSTIVERPHRIRAVKVGVAAAWARLEQHQQLGAHDDDDLDQLLRGLTLGGGTGRNKYPRGGDFKGKGRARQVIGQGGPFDILDSDAQLPVDHAALRYVHPKPNQPPDNNDDGGWESASNSSSAGADADPGPSSTSATEPKPSPLPPWPEQLQSLCRASSSSLHPPSPSASPNKSSARTASEIPPHLPQGDLYLCPGSEPAIFGALGACCEAVDRIVASGGRVAAQQQHQTANVSEDQQDATTSYDRAFVAIRPPGHHCGEANPQGFCFVNNVAVAAAHAHIEHGVDRVVIFDIDLHHGNGTQEIAWRINAEAHEILEERQRRSAAAAALKTPRSSPRKSSPRKLAGGVPIQKGVKTEEEEEEEAKQKDPLRIMYASLHDIWSYPCEDGDPTLVAAASLSLNGGHGQYISNVHLEPWDSEVDFHERLYPKYREGLIERAEDFVRLARRGVEESEEEATRKTLVIVSLGCDASEHESAGMSRHNRNVPTSFYRRFALDATSFAHHHAAGKCLAVLEGGYSDRALASASAAFLSGFAERVPSSSGNERDGAGDRKVADRFTANQERDGWWSEPHLKKLEKACSVAKPRRGGAQSSSSSTMTGLLVGADGGAAIRDPWLARAVEIFAHLEDTAVASSVISSLAPGSGSTLHSDPNTPRQLRDRTKSRSINYAALADGSSPLPSPVRGASTSTRPPPSSSNRLRGDAASSSEASTTSSSSSLPPPVPVLPPAFASPADEAPSAARSDPRAAAHPVFAFTSPDSDPPTPESSVTAPSLPTAATPEAAFTAAGGDSPDPSVETEIPVKPAIRFTWKQGGFGGEPRM